MNEQIIAHGLNSAKVPLNRPSKSVTKIFNTALFSDMELLYVLKDAHRRQCLLNMHG